MAGRRVLVTGVSGYLGSEIARSLAADPEIEHVVGLDERPPRERLRDVEFIEADIRGGELGELLPRAGVDTVIHNKIVRRPGPRLSPRAAHEINVIGTLELLAACERAAGVAAIVIRGSAGIYGAEPDAPQFFPEELARLYPLRTRFQRDVGEIENLFDAFARRNREVVCTMLRYQPAIGPSLDTQITQYLSPPLVPTPLGFDPRIQLVHEYDAVGATLAAVRRPVRGAVNVAGPGTIGLSRLVRRAGRSALPVPAVLFDTATATARRLGGPRVSPDLRRLLRYGRAVDTTRLTEEVGFRPRFSTPDAVEDWVRAKGGRRLVSAVGELLPGR
ncbi:MAG: NAD-dependent epimerase/dehydratase family protein [Thermoleophilaceae bacterium]|jgi:UDP-glucose 4-epimerase|nr:NAD-dependent epimerase/dehydratase family protein [Thermoleophilaceae bacterium]MDQ3241434.1 NAD-dependent epimerase/dehydratase family protein [Actinomycetota bacterium]